MIIQVGDDVFNDNYLPIIADFTYSNEQVTLAIALVKQYPNSRIRNINIVRTVFKMELSAAKHLIDWAVLNKHYKCKLAQPMCGPCAEES